jgi:hypothetical protein
MFIYEIGPGGFLGSVLDIEDNGIIPAGYTRTSPDKEIDGNSFIWENNQWKRVDYKMPEPEERPTWNEVRYERDMLLKGSDWTQLSDAVCDKDAWATYRTELRNITEAFEKSTEVVFPKKPTDL